MMNTVLKFGIWNLEFGIYHKHADCTFCQASLLFAL